jgi:hypothetical protein
LVIGAKLHAPNSAHVVANPHACGRIIARRTL